MESDNDKPQHTVLVLENGDPIRRVLFADVETFGAWYMTTFPPVDGEEMHLEPRDGDLAAFAAYRTNLKDEKVAFVLVTEVEFEPYTMTANVSRTEGEKVNSDLRRTRMRRMERGRMVEIQYFYLAK